MSRNFEKYMAAASEPIIELDDADPKHMELRFVANARKGGTNWRRFTAETKKKKMGGTFAPVPLMIPYTLLANDQVYKKGVVAWEDAITKRRTTQLAYLTMIMEHLPEIDDLCETLRIRHPNSHFFITVKLQADDSTKYPLQVMDNLTTLLRMLNDGKSIERWHDSYVDIGTNEFRQTYNELAKVFRSIERKHQATFKFTAQILS